jgi:hypothetical protein
MTAWFAAAHESGNGTNAKCRLHRAMSEFEGEAENIARTEFFSVLTHLRHKLD